MARAPHSRWMMRAKDVCVVRGRGARVDLGMGDDYVQYTLNMRLELGEFRAATLIVVAGVEFIVG